MGAIKLGQTRYGPRMALRHLPIGVACWLWGALALIPSPAWPANGDTPEMDGSIGRLEAQIESKHNKVLDLMDDILVIDFAIEQRVAELVDYLTSVKDSTASKTRVVRAKIRAMQELWDAATYYDRERTKSFDDLRRTTLSEDQGQLATRVEILDEKVEKRIEDIVRITTSLTGDNGFQRYVYGDAAGGWERRESEAYRQQKRVDKRARQAQRQVVKQLNQDISHLENRIQALEARRSSYRKTDQDHIDIEIAKYKERVERRRTQLGEASETYAPATSLTKPEANKLEDALNDAVADIDRNFIEMVRLKGELDAERIRLRNLRRQLDSNHNGLTGAKWRARQD